tara:strand:- start:94 stop:324 length:231 start_codon:yes stop_codon:yes gene_type:complete
MKNKRDITKGEIKYELRMNGLATKWHNTMSKKLNFLQAVDASKITGYDVDHKRVIKYIHKGKSLVSVLKRSQLENI